MNIQTENPCGRAAVGMTNNALRIEGLSGHDEGAASDVTAWLVPEPLARMAGAMTRSTSVSDYTAAHAWDEAWLWAETALRRSFDEHRNALSEADKGAAEELVLSVADLLDAARKTAEGRGRNRDVPEHLGEALRSIARAGAHGAPVPCYDMGHRIRQQREDMGDDQAQRLMSATE